MKNKMKDFLGSVGIIYGTMALAWMLGLNEVAYASSKAPIKPFMICASPCHGGTYNGPGDTVPPGGGGFPGTGGPSTPGPAGPSTPSPGSPGTPSPGSPGTPSPGAPGTSPGAPSTGGGLPPVDLTQWSFWWEFNKDPYLALKSKIHQGGTTTGSDDFFLGHGEQSQSINLMKPNENDIRTKVIPALLEILATESNNDIITGAMMSLAKIGDREDTNFGEKFTPFLLDSNQEISETAALALGILGSEEYLPLLEELAMDSPAGRASVGETEVPYRTRTFATYGIGLVASNSENAELITSISNTLRRVLVADDSSYTDVKVASIVSMGLLDLGEATRTEQVNFLLKYFRDEDNPRLVRAHIPEAVSFSVKGAQPLHYANYKKTLANEFMNRLKSTSDESREVQQSCVLALGILGDTDDNELDEEIRNTLYDIPSTLADQQTRAFSLIALGHVGSNIGTGEDSFHAIREIQTALIRHMTRGKSQMKSWSAISLGIMSSRLNDYGLPVLSEVATALREEARGERQPQRLGAFSIAAGLAGNPESGEVLLEKLEDMKDDEARGYLCLSLGLLNERGAIGELRKIVLESKYRPELLQQAAIGLGLMGDHELVPELIEMLRDSNSLASQASVVMALSFIGDKRSIEPLVAFVNDDSHTDRARGFAAAALGMVAERTSLPWNSDLSCDLNYRASTTTLNDTDGTGILNIL